jgi:hypothetical protein
LFDRPYDQGEDFLPKVSVDPSTATIGNGRPWAASVDPTPDRIWTDPVGLREVTARWVRI